MTQRLLHVACAAVIGAHAIGCAPLIVGVVVAGTALVATDRRTTGSQLDDQTIQLRVANELSTAFSKLPVHINVNSFDRKVLLTGEVPDEAVKARAGELATASQNVRAVVNELAIAPPSSLGDRTNDTTLATKVRAAFVNTKEIAFNSIEIVCERGVIYLLGLVTDQEFPRVRRRRRPDELWPEPYVGLSPGWRVCRSHSQGCQASRAADRIAVQVRVSHQLKDSQTLNLTIPPGVLAIADEVIE